MWAILWLISCDAEKPSRTCRAFTAMCLVGVRARLTWYWGCGLAGAVVTRCAGVTGQTTILWRWGRWVGQAVVAMKYEHRNNEKNYKFEACINMAMSKRHWNHYLVSKRHFSLVCLVETLLNYDGSIQKNKYSTHWINSFHIKFCSRTIPHHRGIGPDERFYWLVVVLVGSCPRENCPGG